MHLQSEKTEFDENQDENTSGEKESAGLKRRLALKVKAEQGKYFDVIPSKEKRERVVSLVIWPFPEGGEQHLASVVLEKLGEKVILDNSQAG